MTQEIKGFDLIAVFLKNKFLKDKYVIVRYFLPLSVMRISSEYALKQMELGNLGLGDEQVKNTPCAYGDPLMDMLLERFCPKVEANTGINLLPTYSYFRIYKHGDVLKKHKDRQACEISVTINFWSEDSTEWAICLDGVSETAIIQLNPGDALIYRGNELPHWREAFPGKLQMQVFFHYVNRDGKFAKWRFDKRTRLSGLHGVEFPEKTITIKIQEMMRANKKGFEKLKQFLFRNSRKS
ncbi:MAG: hypothetical protein V7K27_29085 [Nostoc sp.]|uniref:hypothetical protein n=1 Tax=Nostoc sp. TaxID=1180 RepID=UPI002FFCF1A6